MPYLLKTRQYGRRGPRIIFLHGIAAQGSIWNPVIKQLSKQYRCITIDLLGYGDSPKPDNIRYDANIQARSLRWTLFWHGWLGKSVIVGHSMGSLIAVRYAAKYRRSVSNLVLVAMPIYLRRDRLDKPRLTEGFIDSSYLAFYRALRRLTPKQAARTAQAIMRTAPQLVGQFAVTTDTWYPIVSSLSETIERQTVAADIKHIPAKLPIQIIYGAMDNLVITSNLRHTFKRRPNTVFKRVLASHEMNAASVTAIVKTIKALIPPK